jgi:hypothetical protein
MQMNRRATDNETLFAALELLVNCGDGAIDFRRFRQQHPHFFPDDFYVQSERLLKSGKKDNMFNWFKRQLRSVWEGRDPQGTRLGVLLGIAPVSYAGPPGGDFQMEVTERMAIFADLVSLRNPPVEEDVNIAAHLLFAARIVPDWERGVLRYEPTIEFQSAIHALLMESWRARMCRTCRKYLIAAKSANIYCSPTCVGNAKKSRDRQYWRAEGKAKRSKKKQPGKMRGKEKHARRNLQ